MEKKFLKIFNKIMLTNLRKVSKIKRLEIKRWDSLNHVKLISELEQSFKINFDLKDNQSIKNLESFFSIIAKKILKKKHEKN
tara:strand:+ start:368 stop:613 length:246 start_codon:yes stop_codon:yes gene_type:complete